MSNTQTKTKKMHVASVTLTNNNESNEKQMLKKKKMVRFKPYERTSWAVLHQQVEHTKHWMIYMFTCIHACVNINTDFPSSVFFDPRVSKQKCVCVCVHPAHLPMKDNTPDEAQGQLVVPIHNICPSYVYQVHLKGGQTKLLKISQATK